MNDIVSPGLTFARNGASLAVAGNTAQTAGNDGGSYRSLPTLLNTGTEYVSFLGRLAVGTAGTGYAGLSLFNGGSENLFIGQLFNGSHWGLDQSTGVQPTTVTIDGTTHLFVAQIAYGAGTGGLDRVRLYVDPTPGLSAPDVAPTIDVSTFRSASFNQVRIQAGGGTSPLEFDELRIGTSFGSVAPLQTTTPVTTTNANGVIKIPRVLNDYPDSTLTFDANYPTSIHIRDVFNTLPPNKFANRHDALLSGDGGTTALTFNNNMSFDISANVTLTGGSYSPRKEAGIRVNSSAGGDGLFMVNSDSGEIVASGGPFPFFKFGSNATENGYTLGQTINLELSYDANAHTVDYKVKEGTTTMDSGPLAFTNLENGIIDGSTAGFYGQFSPNASGDFGDVTFTNIVTSYSVPPPPTLDSVTLDSPVATPGGTISADFNITSPSAQNLLLGASLVAQNQAFSLGAPSAAISLEAGHNPYPRQFTVPLAIYGFRYDFVAKLWRDSNGDGMIGPGDLLLSTKTVPNGIAVGYSPQIIKRAYGIDQVNFGGQLGDGSGQTIGIIEAGNNPNIETDLREFDNTVGLKPPPSFTVVNEEGTTITPVGGPTAPGNWPEETDLDVEWAHAISPGASIILIEANYFGIGGNIAVTDLERCINVAINDYPAVSVVSMSFRTPTPQDIVPDSAFAIPQGRRPITFVASSGDQGVYYDQSYSTPGPIYPAASASVVSVGGTSLHVNADGTWQGEVRWLNEAGTTGSGNGISAIEPLPTYQQGVVPSGATGRVVPDVAFDGDQFTGVQIYDSTDYQRTGDPWDVNAGTSFAAPAWAAMLAIIDQGRSAYGLLPLGSQETLTNLYHLADLDYHKIDNVKFSWPDGLGSPVANLLIPDMVGVPRGSISGSVFEDLNNDGTAESGDPPIGGVTVFLDVNRNGLLDPGEISTATDATGNYLFRNVPVGTYRLAEVLPSGFARSTPLVSASTASVTADEALAGDVSTGPVFGDVRISTVLMNFDHLLTLAQNYGQPGTFATGDLNGDGVVNFADLLLLAQHYGQSLVGPVVVADYQADFNTSGTPAPGWSYLWNANGPLGNSANYVPLAHDTNFGGDYETVANGAWPDPAPGGNLAATGTAVYPGQSSTQASDGVTRYVIAAYTFSAQQIAADGNRLLFHTYDFTVPADAPGPIDVEVYKNNTLVAPFPFPPGTDFSDQTFGQDYPFGTVQGGDTLYIALGASGDYAGQPLGVAYSLALTNKPAAAAPAPTLAGTVGFADLLILAQNYGQSLSTPAAAAASADSADLLLRKAGRRR